MTWLDLGSWGLSPRVRGNRNEKGPDLLFRGSIPARAGEPQSCANPRLLCEVYPRACGGTAIVRQPATIVRGLSPRVRGNRYFPNRNIFLNGSIPARAGEPAASGERVTKIKVYPRACGGTFIQSRRLILLIGLSPRVRGNLSPVDRNLYTSGSIPARAGEPSQAGAQSPAIRVYPRACGGTLSMSRFLWRCRGLSPRVRGNHLD